MRPTIKGEGASVVINQSAPTLCIQVPTFDATDASHNARNNGCDNGVNADDRFGKFRLEDISADLDIASRWSPT